MKNFLKKLITGLPTFRRDWNVHVVYGLIIGYPLMGLAISLGYWIWLPFLITFAIAVLKEVADVKIVEKPKNILESIADVFATSFAILMLTVLIKMTLNYLV